MHTLLCLAAACIPDTIELTEIQANLALRDWLADTGAMLRIDHVELRRTLIDCGLWQRDGYGKSYARATQSPFNPALSDSLQRLRTVAAAAILASERQHLAQQRGARKARAAQAQ